MFSSEALKDEIVNDPEGMGYKNSATPTDWKGDQVIADLLGLKSLVIDRVSVEMEELRAITEFDWYDGMTIDRQEYLVWQTPDNGQWRVSAHMKLFLTGSMPAANGVAGTNSVSDSKWAAADRNAATAAMLPLIEVAGSRAEVLWGEDMNISAGQVGRAFNLI